jgi:hypothetical protein
MENTMSKEIPVLGSDVPALVDDEDYDWASKYDWFEHVAGFVVRMGNSGEKDLIEMGTEIKARSQGFRGFRYTKTFYPSRKP